MANTKQQCHMCGSKTFWLSIHLRLICAECHPPADESLVKKWIDRDTESNTALRKAG